MSNDYHCPKCNFTMSSSNTYVCSHCGARYCSSCAGSLSWKCPTCKSPWGNLKKEK